MGTQPIRILRIVAVMDRGGIETQIMNTYREIDKEKYQYDFLITREENGVFDEEIKMMGGNIYNIPAVRKVGILKFVKYLNEFFKNNSYQIVHCHMNTWSGLILSIAKLNRVPVRIAHSHSAQKNIKVTSLKKRFENIFKNFMKILIKTAATDFWAVGRESAEWLYSSEKLRNKYIIVPNAKKIKSYSFDSIARNKKRELLGVNNEIKLLGHVGSFSEVKNHRFLIELAEKMKLKNLQFQICFIGDGPLKESMYDLVMKKELTKHVCFLGTRNDVNEWMSAFDVLLLPSKFEGMPNVIIESQISGLPSILSSNISSEIDFGIELVRFCDIDLDNIDNWILEIEKINTINREPKLDVLKRKGYDLENQVNWLMNFYDKIYKKSKGASF